MCVAVLVSMRTQRAIAKLPMSKHHDHELATSNGEPMRVATQSLEGIVASEHVYFKRASLCWGWRRCVVQQGVSGVCEGRRASRLESTRCLCIALSKGVCNKTVWGDRRDASDGVAFHTHSGLGR